MSSTTYCGGGKGGMAYRGGNDRTCSAHTQAAMQRRLPRQQTGAPPAHSIRPASAAGREASGSSFRMAGDC